ncbi:hypothetical protein [Polyangium mundeleinium]|uniref:Uncharacterized protein n=1 Tax=Polyangium mundeleinium TaxID=2995306 RepID=A0ABT5EU95_9BACT|nr:hypothetical protein [Polyangium mundeleinium]MDC0745393.1 hypothetical protein [Polyangium mundeleinium]
MRKYRGNASSDVRVEYGVELETGLAQFPETTATALDIRTINDALDDQHEKRRALRISIVKTRATARFAEYSAERVIRSALRAAEIEDGGRRGRIRAAVFPKGSTPIVTPKGRAQVKPMQDLLDRIEHAKVAGIEGYRNTWLPKLGAALAGLEAALAAHEEALAAYGDAFKTELALRDAHHDAVDRAMGMVRAAFPRDRERQDVIFPVLETAAKKGGDVPGEDADEAVMSAPSAQG